MTERPKSLDDLEKRLERFAGGDDDYAPLYLDTAIQYFAPELHAALIEMGWTPPTGDSGHD